MKFDNIAYNITDKRDPVPEDSRFYVGLEHLDSGSLYVTRYGLDVDLKGSKLIMHKGDVLLGKRNAYLRRAAIAPHDGLFSAHGMILRPKEEVVDKNFFPFFISSDKFFDEVIRISVGGLSPTVNWKDLKNLDFKLPSLAEQKVLADKLWAAYRLKESYKKLLITTEEMVKSQFIEMFKDTPIVKLEDYISTQSGGTPNTKKHEYYDDGDIPWLSSGEVNQGYIDSTEKFITQAGLDNSSAKWVPKDCVVIAMYGATAGKVGYIRIPLTTNQAVCSLLPSNEFNSIFLYYAVSQKTDWMISQCRGAAQPNISQGIIRSIELPLPSMSEQNKFVAIAEQADKSEFDGLKSQFIEMFDFENNTHNWPDLSFCDFASLDCTMTTDYEHYASYPHIGIDSIEQNTGRLFGYRTVKEDNVKSGKYIFTSNHIIYSKIRPNLNKVATPDFNGLCSADSYPILPNEEVTSKDFLAYLMRSDIFLRYIVPLSNRTGMPKVNREQVEGFTCPFPPKEEQNKFVAILHQADKSESDKQMRIAC